MLLEFFRSKKPLPTILIYVKISIWTFLFYKKNVREKVHFFGISKGRYFLLGMDIISGLFWDIQMYFLKI